MFAATIRVFQNRHLQKIPPYSAANSLASSFDKAAFGESAFPEGVLPKPLPKNSGFPCGLLKSCRL